MRRRPVVIKTGSTLPAIRARRGDFESWIARGMGLAADEIDVIDVAAGAPLPPPDAPPGIVVTGSSAMVTTREPWSEKTGTWLVDAVRAGTPVLGICYGHQLLAHALGGRVAKNPRGREIGTIRLRLSPDAQRDPLLGALPAHTLAHTTHLESVLELPREARWLAESDTDPNQAFAVGSRAWGVQFHPEFDADVIRGYIEGRRDALLAEGLDPDRLLEQVAETPESASLLRRFAALLGL